jgi:hypothetical protein
MHLANQVEMSLLHHGFVEVSHPSTTAFWIREVARFRIEQNDGE